jgi:hypothetical protein
MYHGLVIGSTCLRVASCNGVSRLGTAELDACSSFWEGSLIPAPSIKETMNRVCLFLFRRSTNVSLSRLQMEKELDLYYCNVGLGMMIHHRKHTLIEWVVSHQPRLVSHVLMLLLSVLRSTSKDHDVTTCHCFYRGASIRRNNAFCTVQRATAQSKTGFFRDYVVAEAPPGFQAGWSGCMHFTLSFYSFCYLIWR